MTRRDALRRLILTLLTLVFGPSILSWLDEETLEECTEAFYVRLWGNICYRRDDFVITW